MMLWAASEGCYQGKPRALSWKPSGKRPREEGPSQLYFRVSLPAVETTVELGAAMWFPALQRFCMHCC